MSDELQLYIIRDRYDFSFAGHSYGSDADEAKRNFLKRLGAKGKERYSLGVIDAVPLVIRGIRITVESLEQKVSPKILTGAKVS